MEDSASSLPSNNLDPSPQIQQNVEGDGNQVIGQVTGGNVFGNITGNVTIYDRIPVSSLPPPISMLPTLTQQEYRQRQVLLDKVQKFWVKGVLQNSLHSRALIELGLQERLDLVKQPFSGVGEFSDAPGQVFLDGTNATAVFEEMGEGRTLLILGEPGAGKTIALLKLVEDLIVRTAPDLRQQIPVVFNLSSWARKPQTIERWLVQELLEKYQVSKALGETWVKSEALILLLDGLDEVRADQRNACVQALNLFMQNCGTTEVVVCCRIQDYQVLKDRLTLRSAICIQPLTSQQIIDYLDRAGDQLSVLKTVLPQDELLQELATSPLMLSIMSLVYQDFTLEKLTLGGNAEDYQKRLFETYVDRMFQRRGLTQLYSRKETLRWLVWMAQQMKDKAQTIFLVERLQFSWLPTGKEKVYYRLGSGFACGMTGILSCGLIYWQSVGLIDGMIIIAIHGLINGLYIIFLPNIKPFETLKWSWKEFRNNFFRSLFLGLVMGLITGSIFRVFSGQNNELIITLTCGLFYGMISVLINGFGGSEIQQREKPNQGIFRSLQNSSIIGIATLFIGSVVLVLCSGLISGLISRPIFGTSTRLTFGLINGLILGIIFGGNACLQHFVLRLILYYNQYAPWNYAHFLDYATERLFLQKVGGGYIFVHRILLEHFAEMSPAQEDR
jgi:NACHT domain